MSLPREVVPGRFYMICRRCVLRQFLLRPDDVTNNCFIYLLGEAAQRAGIDVILPVAMSNHYHVVIFDRHGHYPEFMYRFHQLLARSLNAHRGRWEHFWASGSPGVVRLVDKEDVMRMLVYVATNPIKDHLVDKVHHWPGVNGYAALLAGKPLTATRPRHFFRADGPMPRSVTLELVIPPELGDPDEIRRELMARVEATEGALADDRRRTGRRVLGRRAVLDQSPSAQPATVEPRRGLNPRAAAKDKWSRTEALLRNREFVVEYRHARTRWLAGIAAIFPPGTYWLRRFAGVPVAPLPSPPAPSNN